MKLKLKAVAAAIAFAISAPSLAAISQTSTGNGELFFTVFDPVAEISYTRDLGIFMNDFAAPAAGSSTVFSADATLLSFLSQVNVANLQWAVIGGESLGQDRVFVTTSSTGTPSGPTNSTLRTSTANIANYLVATNNMGTHVGGDVSVNGSNIATSADGPAYSGAGTLGAFQTSIIVPIWNSVGGTSAFWGVSDVSSGVGSASVPSTLAQFGNGGAITTWSFDANGDLTVAAVPEPGAWAMMIAGLVGVGAMARRRMSV